MADIRMTMVGSYDSVVKAISSGKVKKDTYIFIKDKEILSWYDNDGILQFLGNSVQQVKEFPKKGLDNVLYIKDRIPYIYNGNNFVPIIHEKANYDDLDNIPIINLNGSSTNPIIVNELENGSYNIKGVFVIGEERFTTLIGNYVIVNSDADNKYITKVASDKITKYCVNIINSSTSKEEYITDKYLESKGYVLNTELEEKVDALGYIKKAEIQDNIDELVEKSLEKTLEDITEDEIDELFTND